MIKRLTIKHWLIVALVTTPSAALADLQIGIQDGDGRNSTISSNGIFGHMSDSQDPTYVVIDYQKGLFSMVDPKRQQVMQVTTKDFAGIGSSANSKVRIDLQKAGSGPKIAGYATQKFTLGANGTHCSTIFGSQAVLKKKGIQRLMDTMNQFQQQTQKMFGGFRGTMDICTQANLQMADTYKTTGAPLRILDKNGQLESQVVSIETNKNLPPDFYNIPKNFKITNAKEQMKQANQATQQMMESMGDDMPDMNAIMQQLQQSGEITPEMIEQMEKMKELIKQQYQQ